jgi:YbbR domain-containing protein
MEFLFRNIVLKILALVFAITMWFFVVGEKGLEVGFLIPLELKGMPEDLMIINDIRSHIDIRITGPKTLLAGLSPTQMGITLDLSKSKAGNNVFPVFPKDVKAPRGFKVTRVNPTNIKVILEPLITKKVPIKVRLTGKPQKGFKLGEVSINPPEVQVTGAAKGIKDIKTISTQPIDINGKDNAIEEVILLDLSKLHLIKIDSETVTVKINIIEK